MTEEQTNVTTPTDATGGGEQPEPGNTFTQEQLDGILADRLARERAKFGDYDELKAAKAELDKLKLEQLSELEQAQARLAALEAERDQALEQATETLIRSAFVAEAAKAGVAHPEDAFVLAGDLAGIDVGEDGKVTGVAEAVQTLVDAGRLVMSGSPRAPSLDAGAGGGTRAGSRLPGLSQEELDMARKMGITPEAYAKRKAEIAAPVGG